MSVTIPPDLPQLAGQTTAERPWPLRLLSVKIKKYVDRMSAMWVEGEVLQYNPRPSYRVQFFTLRDLEEKVSMNCKAFTGVIPAEFAEGARVILRVKPDFWQGNGSLSLHVAEIRFAGIGDLLARLEELRRKLAAEGLFATELKKPLPFAPRKIGLICGANAKAERDVVVNAQARWPGAEFEIRHTRVQGPQCPGEVMAALTELDAIEDVDVIVITRGGGSVEDLLGFSDEQLVRAAAAATTPIVSAIGHEADRPLLDDVADVRASTPTDAAKLIVPEVLEEAAKIKEALTRGRRAVDARLSRVTDDLDSIRSRPVLANPEVLLVPHIEALERVRERITELATRTVEAAESELQSLLRQLRSLSPQAVLERGYAVLRTKDSVVRSAAELTTGQRVEALLARGRAGLEVIAVKEEADG